MSQSVIKKQFVKYLDLLSLEFAVKCKAQKDALHDQEAIQQLEKLEADHKKFIENLKKCLKDNGFCFGFALCHAAMDISGKLNWWEHALIQMYHWNGETSSLDEECTLPNSLEDKPTTLRKIFELALNFILTNHAREEQMRDFHPKGIKQINILRPNARIIPAFKKFSQIKTSYFEMLDDKGKLHTIKQKQSIGGNFTEEHLDLLLTEETFQGTICLVEARNHAIRIAYQPDGNWILYDSNYSHKNLTSIHSIGNKKEIIHAIFTRLKTHTIAIEVATITDNKIIDFSAYKTILKDPVILENQGLHQIARYAPQYLPELLSLADDTPKGRAICSIIANALDKKNPRDDWTALHFIAKYAPASLITVIKLADDTQEGRAVFAAIVSALAVKSIPDNWTPLHVIAKYAPETLPELLNLIDSSPLGKLMLSACKSTLSVISKPDQCSILHNMARYAPASLPLLLKHINDIESLNLVFQAFSRKANKLNGWQLIEKYAFAYKTDILNTLLDTFKIMANHSPAFLPRIIHLILKNDCVKENLSFTLQFLALATTPDGRTGWQVIHKHTPATEKKRLLTVILNKIELLDTEQLLELGENICDALSNFNSPYHGICKERHTFFRQPYGKTTLWQQLMNKIQVILNNKANHNDALYQKIVKTSIRR